MKAQISYSTCVEPYFYVEKREGQIVTSSQVWRKRAFYSLNNAFYNIMTNGPIPTHLLSLITPSP